MSQLKIHVVVREICLPTGTVSHQMIGEALIERLESIPVENRAQEAVCNIEQYCHEIARDLGGSFRREQDSFVFEFIGH